MTKHQLTGEGGKGSAPRKGDNRKQYEDNWDKIFGKKEVKVSDDDSKDDTLTKKGDSWE